MSVTTVVLRASYQCQKFNHLCLKEPGLDGFTAVLKTQMVHDNDGYVSVGAKSDHLLLASHVAVSKSSRNSAAHITHTTCFNTSHV